MKLFTITSDTHYGWLTGITHDGNQVLAADNVNLFFDSTGKLQKIEDVDRIQNWEERANKLIATPMPIKIQEFDIEGRDISVRPLPEKADLFEFILGDDFWMAPDGTVDSH